MPVYDVYDIAVASMKIGVACPIPNSSFRYWDDAGTWQAPTAWTKGAAIGAGNLVRQFTFPPGATTTGMLGPAFDDDRARVKCVDTSVPDDFTFMLSSTAQRIWHETEQPLGASQQIYYNVAFAYLVGGSGANKQVAMQANFALTSAMSAPRNVYLQNYTSGSDEVLTQYTGSVTPGGGGLTDGYDWFQLRMWMKDIDATSRFYVDNVGVMFNPIDNTGYAELTNVYATNGPDYADETFVEITRSPLGSHRMYDRSGGARKAVLKVTLQDETEATYQTLRRFYDLNKGTPGIPGYPLLIEPNMPGVPPTLMVDIMEQSFPMRRNNRRAKRYSGGFTFQTIWDV